MIETCPRQARFPQHRAMPLLWGGVLLLGAASAEATYPAARAATPCRVRCRCNSPYSAVRTPRPSSWKARSRSFAAIRATTAAASARSTPRSSRSISQGPSAVSRSACTRTPEMSSLGEVRAQSATADFPADSFFDVFVEMEISGVGPLVNLERLRVQAQNLNKLAPLFDTCARPPPQIALVAKTMQAVPRSPR